jgi:dihydroxyacetone kinase-like protein
LAGASGRLYGKLFATIGQHLGKPGQLTKERVIGACEQAISVVKALGRSDVGQKTMLDVLCRARSAARRERRKLANDLANVHIRRRWRRCR